MIRVTAELSPRERYQLLTSLVVPRPIAWISTRSEAGARNLAPFSYFGAVSATPFLVSVSIGSRAGVDKDTLRNIRQTGAFCVNVATERQLVAMNESAGEYGPEVDEFDRAGLQSAEAQTVAAPYVADCPAVLECRVSQIVELPGSPNTLVIGEVLCVRLADEVPLIPGTLFADSRALQPVARLWGDLYALIGETPALLRPVVDRAPGAP
ncbi:MAG TPA: flavin reductase family protein [Longimicrobium sp.]|uniref:flavin reductase family protein n=1 Tax=Longimicrobium sp. TaxID=2029185 RepID=UPI002ED7E903